MAANSSTEPIETPRCKGLVQQSAAAVFVQQDRGQCEIFGQCTNGRLYSLMTGDLADAHQKYACITEVMLDSRRTFSSPAPLDDDPDKVPLRSKTDEHPFGTIKAWMGATHFKMKTLKHVATEMALHVLAYNMTRVIAILGVSGLIKAMTA